MENVSPILIGSNPMPNIILHNQLTLAKFERHW